MSIQNFSPSLNQEILNGKRTYPRYASKNLLKHNLLLINKIENEYINSNRS
jgi:hypothetical protein